MPNKPHAPRGGPSKKSAPVAVNSNSNKIVESDSKKKKPGNWWEEEEPPAQAKKSGGKKQAQSKPEPAPDDAPKKPDTRAIIGGASWTGKLPVNMLAELCQKQKWCKPEYTMRKIDKGYVSGVILSSKEPKTGEMTTLAPILYPKEHQGDIAEPTALEARHFAAAYALFRTSSMKNIHMMMPPKYRDLWKGSFNELKKADVAAGHARRYEGDPFAAALQSAAEEKARSKKLEAEKAAKVKQDQSSVLLPARSKAWDRACGVELGKKTRFDVEELVHQYTIWNENSISIPPTTCKAYLAEIVKLGFRQSHVQEAIGICKDKEEILEWLLTHVPEDDLPRWSLPENYVAGISMAASDLKKEAIIIRLASGGYSRDLCEATLAQSQNDELVAAHVLQYQLLSRRVDANDPASIVQKSGESDSPVWTEEQQVLASIYGDKYTSSSSKSCKIACELHSLNITIHLDVEKPLRPYPSAVPIIRLTGSLPAYIRLSITKQALEHAESLLLGEQMVFHLVDWIEQNASAIISSPGRLSAVSTNVSSPAIESGQSVARKRISKHPKSLIKTPGTSKSKEMLTALTAFKSDIRSADVLKSRKSLPAWHVQNEIVTAVKNNLVTIISGETGSGKSTQSVQFILDDLIERELGEGVNILCTQPRRISALGLADRVSEERGSRVGSEVGYIIRGESKLKHGTTRITFMTTGVLLRRLQTSGGSEDDLCAALSDVSHVFIDEVHERGVDVDFLLALLKVVLRKRHDLRVVLMSATIDAAVFEQYFSQLGTVGRVHVKGRTFPVHDYYKDDLLRQLGGASFNDESNQAEDINEDVSAALRQSGMKIDYDLIARAIEHIDGQLGTVMGGILVFLPGTMEIDKIVQAVQRNPKFHVLPLHASLPAAEQRRVFPPAPKGRRKIIAATNVAETSITIPDIVAVIDTGRVKETSYDPVSGIQKLSEVWASRAACAQRRGRAGRVREGICYKLFTRNAEAKMLERPAPEITRIPLEQLCLSVKSMGLADVAAFLSSVLTAPASQAVDSAMQLLVRIGAVEDDQLTALGRHLAMIPADLKCAKLLVLGSTLGCTDACLTLAALLSSRSPFFNPRDKRDEVKAIRYKLASGQGDFIADLRAYETWEDLLRQQSPRDVRLWCNDNFLNMQTLRDIQSNRAQFVSALQEIGFLPMAYARASASHLNAHNDDMSLVKGLLMASLYPNVLSITFPAAKYAASHTGALALDPEARTIKFFAEDGSRAFVHPSSTCFEAKGWSSDVKFLSYWERFASGPGNEAKAFARGVTPTNVMSVLLFGGPIMVDTLGRGMVVDGWIKVRGWARIGVLIARMRRLLDNVLERKIEDPQGELLGHEKAILNVVRKLVQLDGLDH